RRDQKIARRDHTAGILAAGLFTIGGVFALEIDAVSCDVSHLEHRNAFSRLLFGFRSSSRIGVFTQRSKRHDIDAERVELTHRSVVAGVVVRVTESILDLRISNDVAKAVVQQTGAVDEW